MTMLVEYVGNADVREVRAEDFLRNGITQATVRFNKANGFAVELPDTAALFLTAQDEFQTSNADDFVEVLDRIFDGSDLPNKEDAGVAANLIAAQRQLDSGVNTEIDLSTAGKVKVNARTGHRSALVLTAVANTSAESHLIPDGGLLFPANTIAIGDRLRFDMIGQITNNSGGPVTFTFRWKLNGTTLGTWTTPAVASNAGGRQLRAVIDHQILDFVGARFPGFGSVHYTEPGAFGVGLTRAYEQDVLFSTSGGISLAGANTLSFTVQPSVAHASVIVNGFVGVLNRSRAE